jgi:hypothetical protein
MAALGSLGVLVLAGATGAPAPPPVVAAREVENLVAFARLYGVVRFFYPSDAAASLDWERFAVFGAAQVRGAASATALEAALEQLFTPLGPGIEIGRHLKAPPPPSRGTPRLVSWRYLGPGFGPNRGSVYVGKRTHRALATGETFVTIMQALPAADLQGKTVRLRGRVRARTEGDTGAAALWLRVDRPGAVIGFFDNMSARPIRGLDWREYAIEGPVAQDAVALAFGAMASGAATADFDALDLSARGAEGDWKPVPVVDPGFETRVDGGGAGWLRAGTSRTAVVSQPSEGAPEGRQFLRMAQPPEDPEREIFEDESLVPGLYMDLDLGASLRARVPLALEDSEARTREPRGGRFAALETALARVPAASTEPSREVLYADVIVAWCVLRHFYPYWPEVGVEWEERLPAYLEGARTASSRREHLDVLRALVADAQDGHGSVVDTMAREARAHLPLRLAVLGGELVVTASAAPEVPVGALVKEIGGRPAKDRLAESMRLVSGSPQWRQARAPAELASGPPQAEIRLVLDDGGGRREVALRFAVPEAPPERRPEPICELASGVWYVDLTRASMPELTPRLGSLAAARGVIFDLRGYPGEAGAGVLPHLLEAPEDDQWMHVAKLVGPHGRSVGSMSYGWHLRPAAPRITGRVFFLTDGRAISYAESVMGYVSDHKLATVVGGATAGTNGNVASFVVPGGFTVAFTGMRVTRHNGRTSFHLVGLKPDVEVAPTPEGLRAGRDEVLERALTLLRDGAEGSELEGHSRKRDQP